MGSYVCGMEFSTVVNRCGGHGRETQLRRRTRLDDDFLRQISFSLQPRAVVLSLPHIPGEDGHSLHQHLSPDSSSSTSYRRRCISPKPPRDRVRSTPSLLSPLLELTPPVSDPPVTSSSSQLVLYAVPVRPPPCCSLRAEPRPPHLPRLTSSFLSNAWSDHSHRFVPLLNFVYPQLIPDWCDRRD